MSSPYVLSGRRHFGHQRKSSWEPDLSGGAVTPKQFVKQFGEGKRRVITKILIANNGIAAVKCMRSIRRWAYEVFRNDRVIKFIAMVTPEDLKANAEYIKMADHFVIVPGGTNNNNYANVQLILDMARRTEAEAVWAGWGHASENPKLPHLLAKNGITFIGPPDKAMWALGDKIASSIVAQTAGVPTMAWTGSGLTVEEPAAGKHVRVPAALYKKACVSTVEDGLSAALKVGFPLMIKASEGGGGKGIRRSANIDDFPSQFRQVQAEVPGSPIFLMKLATNARHLEIQVLADMYGNAISLFGRDCSIQRRHQKIIEEASITVAPPDVVKRMEQDAVQLAKMVGYVSAGTVEYLYMPETNEYFFLELNPRLQVEHPCTEMVADVNLPALQLQVAMGIPLHRIKEIRLFFGAEPWEDGKLDLRQENPAEPPFPRGHVIAARITSENPDEGFKPSGGTVEELNFRSSKNVWGYFSVSASGGLHEYADSQFGHCFSWGETREDAIDNMVLALKELCIRGDFRTTVEYLVKLLETAAFVENDFDTAWLDKLISENDKAEKPETLLGVVCASVLIADHSILDSWMAFQNSLERGQVLPANTLTASTQLDLIHGGLKYPVTVTRSGPQTYFLVMNGSGVDVEYHRMNDGGLLLSYHANSYTCYCKEEVDSYRVTIGNKTIVFEKEKDPTVLRAPSAGKLVSFTVEDGGHIYAGDAYAEIEVMKMIMTLYAAENGCITYMQRPGAVFTAGSMLARLILDDPDQVTLATPFDGCFPAPTPVAEKEKLHITFKETMQQMREILDGYVVPEPHFGQRVPALVERLFGCLRDPVLPYLELQESMAVLHGRVSEELEGRVTDLMREYAGNITSVLSQFPAQAIAGEIEAEAAGKERKLDRDLFFLTTQAVVQLVSRYRNGTRGHMKLVVEGLLRDYLEVESHFQAHQYDACVMRLRERWPKDMGRVCQALYSHQQIAPKNRLITQIIEHIRRFEPGLTKELSSVLQELTALGRLENSRVALLARQVLIAAHQPSYDTRHNQVESIFLAAVDRYGHQYCPEELGKLIISETSIFDVLHDFFYHPNPTVAMAALEVYVRRAYTAYAPLNSLKHRHVQLHPNQGTNPMPQVMLVEYQFTLPTSHPNRSAHAQRRRAAALAKVTPPATHDSNLHY